MSDVINTKVHLVETISPQTLTGAWINLGSEIDIAKFGRMALWVDLDINSSVNVRFRIFYSLVSGGMLYKPQICTPGASVVKIEDEYYEINVDADNQTVFDVGLIGANYAQIQVMAGTLGSPAGIIKSAYATLAPR